MTSPLERVRILARHATREQLRDVVVRVAEMAEEAAMNAWTIDAEDIGGALTDAMVCGQAGVNDDGYRIVCDGRSGVGVCPCPVLALLPGCPDIGRDDGGDGAEDRRKHLRAEALWESVGGEE